MSTTTTFNRTNGAMVQSDANMPNTSKLRPFEISDWDPVPKHSRRKLPNVKPLDLEHPKTTRPPPPLWFKTSPNDHTRSPPHENTQEGQPHSAYTYNTFPSISPKFIRDTKRRNSTWAVPRRAYVPPSIPRDENPRCNILYVSNLPAETSEDELEAIFCPQPGYRRMSLHTRANGPSCLVEFEDVTSAAKALRNLYGWPLKHSKTGGIRLSFSQDHPGAQPPLVPPPYVPTPRTPRRAPPPPPLILPVRTSPHSADRSAPPAPGPTAAGPESPRHIIEVESASSPSVEEPTTRLLEDTPDERAPPAETQTELTSRPPADQGGTPDGLSMHTVRGPDYRIDAFDEWRLLLDEAVDMEFDWYPLPPIKQPVRLSESQLVWTYNGQQMSIRLSEDETQRCNRYLEGVHGGPLNSNPTPRSAKPTPNLVRNAKEYVAAWARIVALSWRLSGRRHDRNRTDNAPRGSDTTQRLESYLCLEQHPSSTQKTKLLTIGSLESMEDDFEFFVRARRMLCEAEGGWIQQMIPWSFHQVRLSRFHFPSSGSDDVQASDVISPADLRHIQSGYELELPDGAEIDVHMKVFAHILLEGLRYPEIGRGSRTLLEGIPKLRTPAAFEKESMGHGWGFHVRQSLSIPKIMAWAIIIVVLCLTFVPLFASLSFIAAAFMSYIFCCFVAMRN